MDTTKNVTTGTTNIPSGRNSSDSGHGAVTSPNSPIRKNPSAARIDSDPQLSPTIHEFTP
jgi:hypothetical protein